MAKINNCPTPVRRTGGAATPCQPCAVAEDWCYRLPGELADAIHAGKHTYDLDAQCNKLNEQWLDESGAVIDPCNVTIVHCEFAGSSASTEPLPVEVTCQPVTVQYADCDGILQTATGTTCDLIQVVPHPAAVMKVKICETADRELVKMCDPVSGDEVLIQYDVLTVPPTILGATNLSTNTAYTGSLDALVKCGGSVEVEQEVFCDNGTTFIRWYVIDATGKPTGTYWDTDLEGQPYTVSTPTATYFKNGVQLTAPADITAAQTAIASAGSTVVNCLPPEANATCYQVAEQVTQTYAAVETLEPPPPTPGVQMWFSVIGILQTNAPFGVQTTLTLTPDIQVWDGTNWIDPATVKAQLEAAGYLAAWQAADPRIDRFDVVIVGGRLRVYLFDDENQITSANRLFRHSTRYSTSEGGTPGGENGNGAYTNIVSTRTVINSYKVIASDGIVKGECKTQECLQSISDATGDDLSTLFPGTTFSITKPECCVVKVTTDIGSFTIRKGVTSFVTQEFKCPFSITAVEIVSGSCTLDEIHIISNSSVEG